MVRVHHPPGGRMHLHSPPPPEPKTVRVLKPPGGGSSICFGEDDAFSKGSPKPAATQKEVPKSPDTPPSPTKTSPPSSPSVSEDVKDSKSPSTEAFPTPVEAPTTPEATNGEKTESPKTNGTTNGHQSPSTEAAKEPSEKANSNGTVSDISPPPPATNGNSVSESSKDTSDTKPEASKEPSVQDVSRQIKDASISKPPLHINIPPTNDTHKTPDTACSNSPKPDISHSTASSSPTISSPSVKTPCDDTRDRLFGDVPSTPTNELSSRKVKDHMRSSIFGQSGDSTPSWSKSNGAHSDSSQPTQPQRQRIPPGGFSTKLW